MELRGEHKAKSNLMNYILISTTGRPLVNLNTHEECVKVPKEPSSRFKVSFNAKFGMQYMF